MGASMTAKLQKLNQDDEWETLLDDCVYWQSSMIRYFFSNHKSAVHHISGDVYSLLLEDLLAIDPGVDESIEFSRTEVGLVITVRSPLYTDYSHERQLLEFQKAYALVLGHDADYSSYRFLLDVYL